jgi:hypothetical protein
MTAVELTRAESFEFLNTNRFSFPYGKVKLKKKTVIDVSGIAVRMK